MEDRCIGTKFNHYKKIWTTYTCWSFQISDHNYFKTAPKNRKMKTDLFSSWQTVFQASQKDSNNKNNEDTRH